MYITYIFVINSSNYNKNYLIKNVSQCCLHEFALIFCMCKKLVHIISSQGLLAGRVVCIIVNNLLKLE